MTHLWMSYIFLIIIMNLNELKHVIHIVSATIVFFDTIAPHLLNPNLSLACHRKSWHHLQTKVYILMHVYQYIYNSFMANAKISRVTRHLTIAMNSILREI
jgi:hypothetical protein